MPTKSFKAKYMLVDGNALIHRGFHAVPGLTNKSGEPTGAVYGFTMILLKAIKDIKPTHIALSFDLKGPTFRNKLYDQYKAHRVAAPQELYDQIPRVKEVVTALNIPIFVKEGFEADDVLGTLASEICKKENHSCHVYIVTGDLDTLQLVNSCVVVYTMRKGISDTAVYDERAVRERYGLNPNQMVDYKSLRGDPSDNIPGVKGIGEKTASGLIQEFKSLAGLYEAIDSGKVEGKIKARVLELLTNDREMAFKSHELSTIIKSVPLDIQIPKYSFNRSAQLKTTKLFQELEFRSLLNKLPAVDAGESESVVLGTKEETGKEGGDQEVVRGDLEKKAIGKQEYELVDTAEKLQKLVRNLKKVKEITLDTETTSLNVLEAKLLGVSLSYEVGSAFYIPTRMINRDFIDILASPELKKIGHNIKYDSLVLQSNGYKLTAIFFDTMIAAYLINSSSRQYGLDALAFNELGYQMQPIEDLIGKGKSQISMEEVPVEKVSWYSCEDVDMTLRLKELFEPLIKKENLEKVFYEIEMPLIEVLGNMELNGIKVNSKFLNKLSGEVEIDLNSLESEIYKLTGQEFNLNSPKQLKEVLFDKMNIDSGGLKKIKTGLSTAAGQLEKLRGKHPVIEKFLEYRELSKLQSTYLRALPELVNKQTGRIHTSYNQTIAATGRLSSTDPNLQNIPVRGKGVGSEIRKAFVAEKGYKLLSLDYSQIELRVVAHLAKDEKMTEVFASNEDIHLKTAMEIFGLPKEQITGDMRRDAKTINFGILYGVSSFGLSERITEMSMGDAKKFIAKYFQVYPQVEQYIEQIKLQVNEEAYVKNELGRMRKFPEIKSSQFFIRTAAERAAINFPIQSLAADIIKIAMINVFQEIKDNGLEIKLLLQVHDELVFEVQEEKAEYWAKKIKPLMENALEISVPILVEAKIGDNWGEMEKLSL